MTTIASIAAIFVSVAVAIIQYAQWRTANQKVVVDLYDRRLRVYENLREAIGSIAGPGAVSDEAMRTYLRAQSDAAFLFGDDVLSYLRTLRDEVTFLHVFTNDKIDASTDRTALVQRRHDAFAKAMRFYDEAPKVFAPYIRLTQKTAPFWPPW